MTRRRRGTGAVEPTSDGRFRGRLPGNGGRLNAWATHEEASAELDAALVALASGDAAPVGGVTLAGFGVDELELREARGVRDPKSESSRWRTHIETAYFYAWPMRSITTRDARAWLDGMLLKKAAPGKGHKTPTRKLGRSTIQNTLNLIRAVFVAAVEREIIAVSPFEALRLPRAEGREFDPWTYLLPEEQSALLTCTAIAEPRRLLIAFALGTGMREGEIWNLALRDVDIKSGRIVVRKGSADGPSTKGKRIRRIPLFGFARIALERWLELLKKQENPLRLVWPLPSGGRRQKGEPAWWRDVLVASGVIVGKELALPRRAKGTPGPKPRKLVLSAEHRHDARIPRFHDLRHTCASSLVAGWWGERRWSLEEVKVLLGHRSITTTERYAHLADSALDAAARETSGLVADLPQGATSSSALVLTGRPRDVVGGPLSDEQIEPSKAPSALPDAASISPPSPHGFGSDARNSLSHLRDLNSRPTVYETLADPLLIREVERLRGVIVGLSVRAHEGVRAISAGGLDAYRVALEVLLEVEAAGVAEQEALAPVSSDPARRHAAVGRR